MPLEPRLTQPELSSALAMLPRWALEHGELTRTWKFADFAAAMAFVNLVADEAQAAQHHPDIDIRYNRVRLALVTHDSSGITAKDVAMAATLSKIATSG